MGVYVDDMRAPFRRMIMCHMAADTTDELNAMADKIGVQRKWIQYPGTWKEHYDICLEMRAKAIQFGAVPITKLQLVRGQLDREATKQRNPTMNQL
jgi:hypothetical protein